MGNETTGCGCLLPLLKPGRRTASPVGGSAVDLSKVMKSIAVGATKPEFVLEVFLQPGELYFGDESTRIRTLLGSCISITLWHPRRKIGGMCHYVLPTRGKCEAVTPDGRYADEVMPLFLKEIALAKTKPGEYEVKLFGGGNMFPHIVNKAHKKGSALNSVRKPLPGIAHRNIEVGRALMQQHGFAIKAEQVGGTGRRHVIFDVWSGHVWMRQHKIEDV